MTDATSHAARITVGILAGGRSSRMGRDKAGVIVGDMTLGARAVALARSIARDVVVLGHGRAMPPDIARIDDSAPDEGPVAAVHALLASARADVYVVLAVDMPLLRERDVRVLLAACAGTHRAAHFQDHPLPCVLCADVRWPARGSMRDALGAVGARAAFALDPGALENVNDSSDIDRASRALEKR
jgi:molybdopterin-guanine dinucleotide biosynthesis protein A